MALCTIQNVSFTYPGSETNTLKNIQASIHKGDFILLCGQSGSGKTTLLRQLKKELTPHGHRTGNITFHDLSLSSMDELESAQKIGYIMQNPDDQIVTDKVWHELVFGMENIGISPSLMKRRCAEMCTFFALTPLFHQDCATLSGGQKQLVNLASILMMKPNLLILDEPTAQLDPIAAQQFLSTLKRLNEDFGITIIISEHRMEEVFAMSNRVWILDDGELILDCPTKDSALTLLQKNKQHPMLPAFPTPTQIFLQFPQSLPCPLTIKEGQQFLSMHFTSSTQEVSYEKELYKEEIIQTKEVYFRYQRNEIDILKGLNFTLHKGECCCLLGNNGAGKSTLLQILATHLSPTRGSIKIRGKSRKKNTNLRIAYVPQNPLLLFVKDEVLSDLKTTQPNTQRLQEMMERFQLTALAHQHPYDLSGGEQQRLALCKTLLHEPELLLLDEPTKGLDAQAKQELASILKDCQQRGIGILIATHDIEFAALYSTTCALLFDGEIIIQEDTHRFLSGNDFYTTAASRLAKKQFPHAITIKEVIQLCKEHPKANEPFDS